MQNGVSAAYENCLAHFIVLDDVERSYRFYGEVLGGKRIRSSESEFADHPRPHVVLVLLLMAQCVPTSSSRISRGFRDAERPTTRVRPVRIS
jgi:catechol 2,3-dioxygenase-like lactoylglutathione lyase family enzyme